MSGARREHVHPHLFALERQVAQRIRLRRQDMGMTQAQLAVLIGVTYQQVHRYEKGTNRIAAAHLHAIALALATDVAFFFQDIETDDIEAGQRERHCRIVELMNDVMRIADPRCRTALCVLARALAEPVGLESGQSRAAAKGL